MTNNLIEMTEDEFDAQYELLKNYLNPNSSWAFGDGLGCLFETFGEEFEFVRRQDPATVWPLLNGEDGDLYVVNCCRFADRLGYLVSTVARLEGLHTRSTSPCRRNPYVIVQPVTCRLHAK